MTEHVNQVIEITIRGDTDIVIGEGIEKSFNITKDMSDEPNEASVEIYNLNPDTRAAIKAAADKYTPIEIAFSGLGSADPVRSYVGEIESVINRNLRPGFSTEIRALSEKRAHRSAYVTQKTYVAGTSKADIVKELTDAIGLPVESDTIPTVGILLSHSFSGAAFPILQRFVFDMGMYCFITDGVLHISNVYDPPSPIVVEITPAMFITEPQETTRTNAVDTELHTVTDISNLTPFRKKKRRKKTVVKKLELEQRDLLDRNLRESREENDNGYVEIDAIDIVVPGIEIECFGIPTLNPDNLITLDGGQTHYRVFHIDTWGDDLREGGERPTTRIKADRFEGDVSDTGAVS
jgi:hypothetical protein